ncbi:MAG: cell division protein ZapA [Desulfovibrionaceae bacterium]|jgi:cell division protein ZapA|nr:cell division protein ZapA [Desulfovibrionaceae bacterium]
MPSYNLSVLDLNVSFKAEADPQRIQDAKTLVEERYEQLHFQGKQISKEKMLTFLALGLADDLLMSNHSVDAVQDRVERLVAKIDAALPKER